MDENREIRDFLAKLRRFIPESVIYQALSPLPEDIFDPENQVSVPELKNDKEIQEFIKECKLEDPQNLMSFFMEQYMENLDRMIDEFLEEAEISHESYAFELEYMSAYG